MCKIISCGFPFVSEMAHAFPDLLGEKQLKQGETARAIDFTKYMEGKRYFFWTLLFVYLTV